ncbi:hypothetical protein BMS3Abin08_02228 [bacterium BMS3Abin08]|nr:hypothetical protein BMS3Abin08_02228 [bacterium BMS3Abin08]
MREIEQLCKLLGDRTASLLESSVENILSQRPDQRYIVYPHMLKEPGILSGNHGIDQIRRDILQADVLSSLNPEFADKGTIESIYPRARHMICLKRSYVRNTLDNGDVCKGRKKQYYKDNHTQGFLSSHVSMIHDLRYYLKGCSGSGKGKKGHCSSSQMPFIPRWTLGIRASSSQVAGGVPFKLNKATDRRRKAGS